MGHRGERNLRVNEESDWKLFERFVGKVEQLLRPQGAIVKINDQVRSYLGHLRQVDATVRMPTADGFALILIECRKRKKISDTLWIEQLVTKRTLLRAEEVIVVSNQRLTAPALQVAHHFGITVRMLADVKPEDVPGILRSFWFSTSNVHYNPPAVQIQFPPGGDYPPDFREAFTQHVNLRQSLMVRLHDEEAFVDLETILKKERGSHVDMPPGSSGRTYMAVVLKSDASRSITLSFQGRLYPITAIRAEYAIDVTENRRIQTATSRYHQVGRESDLFASQFAGNRADGSEDVIAMTDVNGTFLSMNFPQSFVEEMERYRLENPEEFDG